MSVRNLNFTFYSTDLNADKTEARILGRLYDSPIVCSTHKLFSVNKVISTSNYLAHCKFPVTRPLHVPWLTLRRFFGDTCAWPAAASALAGYDICCSEPLEFRLCGVDDALSAALCLWSSPNALAVLLSEADDNSVVVLSGIVCCAFRSSGAMRGLLRRCRRNAKIKQAGLWWYCDNGRMHW